MSKTPNSELITKTAWDFFVILKGKWYNWRKGKVMCGFLFK